VLVVVWPFGSVTVPAAIFYLISSAPPIDVQKNQRGVARFKYLSHFSFSAMAETRRVDQRSALRGLICSGLFLKAHAMDKCKDAFVGLKGRRFK
jgi:hypothetical protein